MILDKMGEQFEQMANLANLATAEATPDFRNKILVQRHIIYGRFSSEKDAVVRALQEFEETCKAMQGEMHEATTQMTKSAEQLSNLVGALDTVISRWIEHWVAAATLGSAKASRTKGGEIVVRNLLRGMCVEASKAAAEAFPGILRTARGFVLDGAGEEHQHWWCVNVHTGSIVDPTVLQFDPPPVEYREIEAGESARVCGCQWCGSPVMARSDEEAKAVRANPFCGDECRTAMNNDLNQRVAYNRRPIDPVVAPNGPGDSE